MSLYEKTLAQSFLFGVFHAEKDILKSCLNKSAKWHCGRHTLKKNLLKKLD